MSEDGKGLVARGAQSKVDSIKSVESKTHSIPCEGKGAQSKTHSIKTIESKTHSTICEARGVERKMDSMLCKEKGIEIEINPPPQNIIALDIGLRRIGMARYLGGIALPCEPLLRRGRDACALKLSGLLKEMGTDLLLIGLPSDEITRLRIKDFSARIDYKGARAYVDEDFTSKEGAELSYPLTHKQRKVARARGYLDSLAALLILRRYLEARGIAT